MFQTPNLVEENKKNEIFETANKQKSFSGVVVVEEEGSVLFTFEF